MSHSAAPAGPTAPASVRERILVCDDDAIIRDTIVEALKTEKLEVETAERAVDAIQRIMRTSYRALLLDLKLPGLGGLDAIAVVKRFDEALPIIVMTGHASYETEQAARAAGIFYYLVKPFNLEELVAAVRAAIRFRESSRRRNQPAPGDPRAG
jgi:DNA-binding response OmpR family regulator